MTAYLHVTVTSSIVSILLYRSCNSNPTYRTCKCRIVSFILEWQKSLFFTWHQRLKPEWCDIILLQLLLQFMPPPYSLSFLHWHVTDGAHRDWCSEGSEITGIWNDVGQFAETHFVLHVLFQQNDQPVSARHDWRKSHQHQETDPLQNDSESLPFISLAKHHNTSTLQIQKIQKHQLCYSLINKRNSFDLWTELG